MSVSVLNIFLMLLQASEFYLFIYFLNLNSYLIAKKHYHITTLKIINVSRCICGTFKKKTPACLYCYQVLSVVSVSSSPPPHADRTCSREHLPRASLLMTDDEFLALLGGAGPGAICHRLSRNKPSMEMNLLIHIKQPARAGSPA